MITRKYFKNCKREHDLLVTLSCQDKETDDVHIFGCATFTLDTGDDEIRDLIETLFLTNFSYYYLTSLYVQKNKYLSQ